METRFDIRPGRSDDALPLSQFAARLFAEAFGDSNRPENLAAYTAEAYGPEQQKSELADPATVTLLAETGRRLAGFAQIRRRSQPAGVPGSAQVELWRFYVDRPWQGTGLAQQLMTAALTAAARLGGRAVWLSCWEKNPRALAFYRKNGFRSSGTNAFWVGTDCQTDHIMIAGLPST